MKRAALAFVAVLAGCSAAPAPPPSNGLRPTIVSLNPCTDAILAEVTAPGQLLAISHYSHDPAASSMAADQAAHYAATGGTVEEVLALSPDVVVASSFLDPATRAALERLGVRVQTVGIAASVEESAAQVRMLAALAGQPQRGDKLADRIEASWQDAAYTGPQVPTLLWQQGGVVPGPDSLIARMMAHTGFALHSAARGLGQGAYLPLEQVLTDPPALVLASGDEAMLRHPALRTMPDTQWESFDPSLVYCAGPSIPRALARLRQVRARL